MKKILFIIAVICMLSSCINPNKIEVSSMENVEFNVKSISGISVSVDLNISNQNRPIEILDAQLDLFNDGHKIAVLRLAEPATILQGVGRTTIRTNINILGGLMGYAGLLKTFSNGASEPVVDGYVKVKSRGFSKKFRLKQVPLSAIVPKSRLKNIFEQSSNFPI